MAMEYFSDASLSSESEDEEEPVEIFCERELDYWAIEELIDLQPPPPVLEYIHDIGMFVIRECIICEHGDIRDAIDSKSAYNWDNYWSGGQNNPEARFSFTDFEMIGEYCMLLCENVYDNPTQLQIKLCMINILKQGKFI